MPNRRWNKRVVLAGLVAAFLACLLLGFVWRGVSAGPVPTGPTTEAEGLVSALVALPDGRRVAWAARVLPHPAPQVWAAVTDYPAFPRIFPFLSQVRALPEAGGVALEGEVAILGMKVPFAAKVAHQDGPPVWRASWDTPSPQVPVNRGSWTLEDAGNGKTRVIYQLDLELEGWPLAVVRSYLRDHIGSVIDALATEVARRPGGGKP